MEAGNLARWIEELDSAHEKLKKRVDKIVAGGGFDPSAYVYTTPFIDLSGEYHTIAYFIPFPDQEDPDEGLKHLTYTVSEDSIVMVDLDASESPESSNVTISNGTDTVTLFTSSDGLQHLFTICIKAGQTIRVTHTDTNNARAGHVVFYIWPLQDAQLQEAPVGLLGRIVMTVKRAIKGGD